MVFLSEKPMYAHMNGQKDVVVLNLCLILCFKQLIIVQLTLSVLM